MADHTHIVILGPSWPLRGGGMSTFNERLARQFMQEGHQVTIYTFSLQYPSFLFPGKSQYSEEPAPEGLDIRVRVNSVNPFNWFIVGRELKALRPDLLIVRYWLPLMGPCLGTIARLVRSNHHTRVICIADNVVPHEKRPGDAAFTRYFLQAPHAFITMSQKVTEDLGKFRIDKPVKRVEHPLYDNFGAMVSCQEARDHLELPADGKLILFFGFIRAYKGLDLLLRAMALEPLQNMDVKLLIAGEFYQDRKPYMDLISHLGLTSKVMVHDKFIADSEVKYFCCAADFIIQPYRNATQSGVTPLAYHFEVPMVVTNVGGLPDMVENGVTGMVVEPREDSIANGIAEAYRQGRDHFIPSIRQAKKKYSWHTLASAILETAYEDHQ